MKVSQVQILANKLKESLTESNLRGLTYSKSSQQVQYRNLFSLVGGFLSEHNEFIRSAQMQDKLRDMLSSLDYLETILDMKIEEINEKEGSKERNFLDSAQDKLKQAGISFDNKDYSGVSNKLNTAVELALKDTLDIPSTIRGINTSKIIDILISEKLGPVEYLKEVKNHVLMDNLVKHQGVSPVESRAVTAITSVENLFKKLKEPIKVSQDVKDKIWSDAR